MTIITKAFTTTVKKEKHNEITAFQVETASGMKQKNNECKRLVHMLLNWHSAQDISVYLIYRSVLTEASGSGFILQSTF